MSTPTGPAVDSPRLLNRTLPDIIGVLVLILVFCWLMQGLMLNHDTSWYLISTEWWLDGARIGEEIVELNPPLAQYLTAPAVLLARLGDWDSTGVMVIYTAIIWFVSAIWFNAVMARCPWVSDSRRRVFLAVACLSLFLLSLKDFAERDHLMIVFALPYFALAAFQPDRARLSTTERALIGLYALLGLALKPYFLIFPAVFTLVDMVRRRSLAPVIEAQNLAMLAGCVAYLVAIIVIHPAYFEIIVPKAWITYDVFGSHPVAIVLRALPVYVAWLLALYGLTKLSGASFDVGLRLLVAALAGQVTFFVQFKGWTYQLVPAAFLTFLVCAWIVLALLQSRRDWFRASALAVAMAVLLVVPPASRGAYKNVYPEAFIPFFENEPGERSFLAMTTNVSVSFPMANLAGAEPVSRFPALWVIPGAISRLDQDADLTTQDKARLDALLAYARRATAEDFVRGVPELVFVDDRDDKPYFKGSTFDYLSFFLEDPAFAALWQRYRYVGTTWNFDVYRLDG